MAHERRTDRELARTVAWGLGVATLLAGGCVEPGSDDPLDASPMGEATAASTSEQDDGLTDDGDGPGTTDDATDGDAPPDSDGDTTDDGDPSGDETGQETGSMDEPGPDLRVMGPWAVQTQSGSAALPTGCTMNYDIRVPEGAPDAPAVILAHGFMGNRTSMAGWAEHWASWGVRVVTPDLCHATILDADHPQNGADLRALASDMSLGAVIYAGYSAGGLAAVLAAADDATALAVLGLDMVDSGGLGASAAASVAAPAFDIAGEPAMCNEGSNGPAVFLGTAQGHALRVTDADHCDFQSPADLLCGLTCAGGGGQFDDATIQSAVLGLSTAAVVWHAGLEPTGAQWWTPGAPYYAELTDAGIVRVP